MKPMAKPIIETYDLGKKYRIHSPRNEGTDWKLYFESALHFKGMQDVWALKHINLQIEKGEIIALMGNNGSGKSTLFRLLSEITDPTEGEIILRGKVSSMIEVGVGFHLELSGRENIYLNGTVLGMSKAEIDNRFDEIVAFSEIEQYLDVPIKKYSNGMYVRLAFAVASHLRTDILLVDEVLSVSDQIFREKSIDKLRQLAQEGCTIMMVSHDTAILKNLCTTAIMLERGKLIAQGELEEILQNSQKN